MAGFAISLVHLVFLSLIWIPVLAYYASLFMNTYWKRKGIAYIPASPIFGNLKEVLFAKKSAAEAFGDFYSHPEAKDRPFVGINTFHKPALVIRDPELVKRILVKDFSQFSNRFSNSDVHADSLGGSNLFFMRNPGWRYIRAKLTPVFTSGKMKQMFYLMNEIGTEFSKHLSGLKMSDTTRSTCIELKDLCARYTTDVIASCAFGLKAYSIDNPNSEFRENGRGVFHFNWKLEASKFLRSSIGFAISERERTGQVRNDLIDTLVALKREDENKVMKNKDEPLWQGDTLVAQAAVFFTAGFETSSATISFSLFELAWKPEIQERLRAEIRTHLTKSGGQLTYDLVKDMEYLHMIVSETLRMYPPLPFLDRQCTPTDGKGYSLEPFDDFVVPKGMAVFIPLFGLHRDPQYFPNPNEFDPERFNAKNNAKSQVYMPFGIGPHNCIGERFGLYSTKVGLINFLRNHHVKPSVKTPRRIELDEKALIIQSKGGIYLDVVRDPMNI